jgi:hypothetical protein
LRPSLATEYAPESHRVYAGRLRHYQSWCAGRGYQLGAEHITSAIMLEYLRAQVSIFAEWAAENPPPPPAIRGRRAPRKVELPVDLLRPNTLHQSVNALLFYAERAAPRIPDDREARELVRDYRAAWREAQIPPAYQVEGRRSPKRGRRVAATDESPA